MSTTEEAKPENHYGDLIGGQRLISDSRQNGGLVLALGICAMFGSLAGVASGVGRDGGNPTSGIPLWSLIGAVCQSFLGAVAILVGYLALVGDTGHRYLTLFLCGAIQLAWIPYVTNMSNIGKQAANPETQTFIPGYLEPTDSEVKFVGAMGVLAILAHGFAFIGSLAFASFGLLVCQSDSPTDRPAGYFRSRLLIYSLAVFVAGCTQLSLGAFVLEKYGGGALDESVNVAVYTIFFPEISLAVGFIQLLTGGMGMVRYFGDDYSSADWTYQSLCFFNWLMMMILQLMVQVSFAPAGQFAAAAPSRACAFFGMSFMPAYLDYKMRNTPIVYESSYYGIVTEDEKVDDSHSDGSEEGYEVQFEKDDA